MWDLCQEKYGQFTQWREETPPEDKAEQVTAFVFKGLLNIGLSQAMGAGMQRAGGVAGQVIRAINTSNLAAAAESAAIVQGAARAETIADALTNAGIVAGRAAKLAGPVHLFSQQSSNQQPQRESTTPVENEYFNGKTRLWGDKEVPRDKHTILKNDKSFIRTNYENQRATVYKKKKYYYCRDQMHKG